MEQICLTCYNQPSSRSFNCVCETKNKGEFIFYTKVADAKLYNDTTGILTHYENMLNYVNPEAWIWIFDCKDYKLKHSLQIKTVH